MAIKHTYWVQILTLENKLAHGYKRTAVTIIINHDTIISKPI